MRRSVTRGTVLRTGGGPERAARQVGAVEAAAPRAVAVTGFGGGLDPSLSPGDIVVATEVRGPSGVRPCPGAELFAAELRRRGLPARTGPVISVAHLVTGKDRRRLAESGALAVDMESAWLAEAVGDRPFLVVRAIVDTVGSELLSPSTVSGGLRAARTLRRAAAALDAWVDALGAHQVLLAAPRSFCAGVDRAIEIVERALDRHGPPVYVRKQIVHNVHVVQDLERRGAVFVDSATEVPEGSLIVFSAHGVSPEVRRQADERRLRVIDATCPLVTKVHAEARRFARAGYTIFLIGHEGHEEVEGTTGEAPDAIRLVDGDASDDLNVADPSRVAYLSQTTLAVDDVNEVLTGLRERFPQMSGPGSDDICYATQNRQDAVKALAHACDLLLVVGSENSSNSNRLVEVSAKEGTPAYLVDDENDVELSWLKGVATVGITAGASAPERLVDRVIASLRGLGTLEVEERQVVDESMRFTLPVELRDVNERTR